MRTVLRSWVPGRRTLVGVTALNIQALAAPPLVYFSEYEPVWRLQA